MKDASKTKNQLINELVQLRQVIAGLRSSEIEPEVDDKKRWESEVKYRTLYESANDAIFIVEGDRFVESNSKTLEIFGCRQDQIIGKTPYHYSPERQPDGRFSKEKGLAIIDAAFKGTPQFLEWKHCRYDRTEFDAEVSLNRMEIAGDIFLLAIVRDVTERKQAEEDLRRLNEKLIKEHTQRKHLSKRLIQLLESGYHQVAMELHDHIGQALVTLKIDLDIISGEIKKTDVSLNGLIEKAKNKTVHTIEDIEKIASGLRPSTIDNLGLVPSLRDLLKGIKEHQDMEIHFFTKDIPKRFDQEKELAIYRVVQEALTNIMKHARAKKCFVNLVRTGESIRLSLEDDGVGFEIEDKMKVSRGKAPLGLLIMQERIAQLRGEFSVESQIGRGTHLSAEIPL